MKELKPFELTQKMKANNRSRCLGGGDFDHCVLRKRLVAAPDGTWGGGEDKKNKTQNPKN